MKQLEEATQSSWRNGMKRHIDLGGQGHKRNHLMVKLQRATRESPIPAHRVAERDR